jgi:hypothetical protein
VFASRALTALVRQQGDAIMGRAVDRCERAYRGGDDMIYVHVYNGDGR